jgi:hypothetical protein
MIAREGVQTIIGFWLAPKSTGFPPNLVTTEEVQ